MLASVIQWPEYGSWTGTILAQGHKAHEGSKDWNLGLLSPQLPRIPMEALTPQPPKAALSTNISKTELSVQGAMSRPESRGKLQASLWALLPP